MSADNTIQRKNVLIRILLWLVTGIVILYIGSYLYAVLYIKFGGQDIKAFCNENLKEKRFNEITTMAKEAGFAEREQYESVIGTKVVYLAIPGRIGGHQCHISFEAGMASEIKVIYIF